MHYRYLELYETRQRLGNNRKIMKWATTQPDQNINFKIYYAREWAAGERRAKFWNYGNKDGDWVII